MANLSKQMGNVLHILCLLPVKDKKVDICLLSIRGTSKFSHVHAPFWEQGSRGGLLASGMSHRRAWEIVALRKIKVAIVLEDDINHYAHDFDEYLNQFTTILS